MARELLTAASLKARLASATKEAAETGAYVKIGDGDGLMLVVRPSGEASWVLRYSFHGAREDYTIGRWPAATLKIAREEAAKARAKVVAGVSPVADRKLQRERHRALEETSRAKADSVRQLMEDWLARERHSAVYEGNIRAAFKKDVLSAIGAKPPHEVSREDCLKILRAIEAREAHDMVRRVRMWMRQMFEFGADDERRPLLTLSPVPMGTLRSFAKHDAGNFPAITRAGDVPELMRKIRRCGQAVNRAALLFSAYVFQRPSEVREATWEEFDLEAGVWTIPEDRVGRKGGGEHLVPLSSQVVELLRQHQGVVGEEGFLFPGRRYERPISEGTLTSALNAMGFKGRHSPHGFRAMARTIGEEVLGIDAKLLEKQLAHEYDPSGLRGAYNRAEYWDDRVTMMRAWSDWLEAQA